MKLVTYVSPEGPGVPCPGVLLEDGILDIHGVHAHRLAPTDRPSPDSRFYRQSRSRLGAGVTDFLERGPRILKQIAGLPGYARKQSGLLDRPGIFHSPSDVDLKPPLDPISLRDGLCSETHFQNSLEKVGASEIPDLFYERPFYYRTSHTELGSHGEHIPWPRWGDDVDFELELACVIGKSGRDLRPQEAQDVIAGYTIFNDLSIRDYQSLDMSTTLGPSKCKNFERGNILGPCMVTSDSFDPKEVEGRVRVNGETWTETDNSDMVHSFPELVSFISQGETLYPGEVIAAGTFAYGCGLELGQYLEPGDRVELEIDGIGVLENRIGSYET